jgi:hypothetical protein
MRMDPITRAYLHNAIVVAIWVLLTIGSFFFFGIGLRGSKEPSAKGHLPCGFFAALFMFFLGAMALPGYLTAGIKAPEAEVKSNLHNIQIALERYAKDHGGIYPQSTGELISENYLPQYPHNPFTDQPMREIDFGTAPFDGEFTYLPFTTDGKVDAYYLIAYGYKKSAGEDIDRDGVPDHVILVVEDDSTKIPLADWLKALKDPPVN